MAKRNKTLTRGQAHDEVDAAAQMGALEYLSSHWIGHDNKGADDLEGLLHEYVDERADMLRDTRSGRNPKDSDRTDLLPWDGVL